MMEADQSSPGVGDDLFELRVATDVDGTCHVILRGELDMVGTPPLEATLRDLPAGPTHVRLDLSQLSFIDSAGLKALLTGHELMGGRLPLASPQPQLLRVLQITGLDQHFTVN